MRAIYWACALTLLLPASCGKKQQFIDVTGVIKMDGKPLPNVLVQFHPEPIEGLEFAPSSEAVTDSEGKFRLTCPQQGRDGAIIAAHRILLIDLNVKDQIAENQKREPPRFSLDYSRTDASDLRCDVKEGMAPVELVVTKK